jgi:hypothetical protein
MATASPVALGLQRAGLVPVIPSQTGGFVSLVLAMAGRHPAPVAVGEVTGDIGHDEQSGYLEPLRKTRLPAMVIQPLPGHSKSPADSGKAHFLTQFCAHKVVKRRVLTLEKTFKFLKEIISFFGNG